MPPKTPSKPKASNASKAARPPTPQPSPGKAEAPKPKATPRKPRTVTSEFFELKSDVGEAAPVKVSHEEENPNSITKKNGFHQLLKLQAPRPFSLVTSILLEEGPYAGHQAILIKPAKSFPFTKLPLSVRNHVYRLVLAPDGDIEGKISINGNLGRVQAKEYSNKDKERLSLFRVNKEILNEARPVLFSFTLSFETCTTLLAFLSGLGPESREQISSVEICQYQKASATAAFNALSEAKNLQAVHIARGIGLKNTPGKVAKSFYTDASRFFATMAHHKGDKMAGIAMFTFGKGKKCFSIQEEDETNPRAWTEEEFKEFKDYLKAKMQSQSFRFWTCVCGSVIQGHVCATEMTKNAATKRRLKKDEMEELRHFSHGGAAMLIELGAAVLQSIALGGTSAALSSSCPIASTSSQSAAPVASQASRPLPTPPSSSP